ncbi:MAG: hypothetical protein JXR60_05885 [Bacteroidales bacterium]|nr:hypothetical protein [Bacteroidales bacterium]
MKSRLLILLLFIVTCYSVVAQTAKEVQDTVHHQTILLGAISDIELSQGDYADWFIPEKDNYELNQDLVSRLNSILSEGEYKIKIFLATWCSDSREQVPRFFKLYVALANAPEYEMYALDAKKHMPDFDTNPYAIDRVPIFIIYKDDTEVGRIIETPKDSFEQDLLTILEAVN